MVEIFLDLARSRAALVAQAHMSHISTTSFWLETTKLRLQFVIDTQAKTPPTTSIACRVSLLKLPSSCHRSRLFPAMIAPVGATVVSKSTRLASCCNLQSRFVASQVSSSKHSIDVDAPSAKLSSSLIVTHHRRGRGHSTVYLRPCGHVP